MTKDEAIRALWEAATGQWYEADEETGDPIPLAEQLDQSCTALPGLSIKGKELYRIGEALGLLDECDGSGQTPTGECRVAMSGPTCRNPDCPPCQTPETDPCSGCRRCEDEMKGGAVSDKIEVPEEWIRLAADTGFETSEALRASDYHLTVVERVLQAILPKVRERLVDVAADDDSPGLELEVAQGIVEGAFDRAFPPEGSED